MFGAFILTKVKCAVLRLGNVLYEGGNYNLLEIACFISRKLANNISETFVTRLFLEVSAESLTATLTVTFLFRIRSIWSNGAALMGWKLLIIG